MVMSMANVIIIGSGPAGVSAALYTKRANYPTLLISHEISALQKADKIENYYGFAEPISGKELMENGITQAKRLGCEFLFEEVTSLSFQDKLTVSTAKGNYSSDVVILATGTVRNTPKIEGIQQFEGNGISYCAVCDAFFYRGKDVCVLGSGEYALHEATELLTVADSVTFLTDGEEPTVALPDKLIVEKRKISAFLGDSQLHKVVFTEGEPLETTGVFVAKGTASSSDLARKIGAQLNGNNIQVNAKMATNVPGLYAAGDCVGGLLQIAKAVSDGAQAGLSAIQYLREK